MKKGPSKETLQTYLSCFVEMKNSLDQNPRIKLSDFASRYKIGKQPITVLKSTGVITQINRGHKWSGPEPSFKMIMEVLEIIRRYHVDLKERKSQQGDLFKPKSKKRNYSKGSETPKFINPEVQKNIDLWRENYQNQKADQTAIPIRIEIYDRSTASEINETTNSIDEQKEFNRSILKSIFFKFLNLFKCKK